MPAPILMPRDAAAHAPFADLARNVRESLEWAKQVGGHVFDEDLLTLLIIELEKKIGGRRPELPPPPVNPALTLQTLPQPHPTKSQFRTKKRLVDEIRAAERLRRSSDQQVRHNAEEHIKALQNQLDDLRFSIAISGLAPFRQKQLWAERGSPEERKIRAAAHRMQLDRYEQDTAETRQRVEEWDARYGGNPAEYATRLRIVEHLRTDADAYARGDLGVSIGKLAWRILPPGHWGAGELAAGQYFTPRPLIAAMVDAIAPQPGQTICDPACGTGGFLLAAHDYIANHYQLDREQKKKLKSGTLFGIELVDSVRASAR